MDAKRAQQERIFDNLRTGLGLGILTAIREPSVTDIKVGGDGKLILKTNSNEWRDTSEVLTREQRRTVLNILASQLGKTLNERTSQLSGELPLTGDRVEGAGPPVADYSFVIRRHSSKVFTLTDYVEAKILTQWQADLIRWHLHNKSNIVVSGAVDSGKTTFINCLLGELPVGMEHIVIVEDTAELKYFGGNAYFMKTSETTSMRSLVRSCLRLNPDRIIIGETRGAEGLELLKAFNTGRRGCITTVHADHEEGALMRFAQFCQEGGVEPQWLLMEKGIDLIIQIAMTPEGRKITGIKEVKHDENIMQMPVKLQKLGPPQAMEEFITNRKGTYEA